MEKLLHLLNGMEKPARAAFCAACGTTENYFRRAISSHQPLGPALCINVERESSKLLKDPIRVEDLRTDVDWAYIRQCNCIVDKKRAPAMRKTTKGQP